MDQQLLNVITSNLVAAESLVKNLTTAQFKDKSVKPYYSSIGSHLRHVLDVFSCTAKGIDNGHVNIIARDRNELVETIPTYAITYLHNAIDFIDGLQNIDKNRIIQVTDNLGQGEITLPYTIASLLAQAHSHAIHHYACIGYILAQLDVEIPDGRFGYNPTTP